MVMTLCPECNKRVIFPINGSSHYIKLTTMGIIHIKCWDKLSKKEKEVIKK